MDHRLVPMSPSYFILSRRLVLLFVRIRPCLPDCQRRGRPRVYLSCLFVTFLARMDQSRPELCVLVTVFYVNKDKIIWNLCVDFLVLFCLPVLVGVERGMLVFVYIPKRNISGTSD